MVQPSVTGRDTVTIDVPEKPGPQNHVFGVICDSAAPIKKGCGRGRDNVTISLSDKARLNTRRSLIEPEKSSPTVPAGVKPFQPRRRVDRETEEMANVEDVDEAILDPSTYAVRVVVDEPE